MWRTIIAIVAGLLTAMLLMFAIESLGWLLAPPTSTAAPATTEDLARLVAQTSPLKKAMVVFGWALAALVGGWVAAKIARHPCFAATAIGGLIVVGCIMNAINIPHPLWMNVLGVALPIPLALLGGRLTAGARFSGKG